MRESSITYLLAFKVFDILHRVLCESLECFFKQVVVWTGTLKKQYNIN